MKSLLLLPEALVVGLALVLLLVGRFGGKPTSFYDLFRVADGKVAEHWVPLRLSRPGRLTADWKNQNGKF